MGGTICRCRGSDQVAKALLNLPWFLVRDFMSAYTMAEEQLGAPPNVYQAYVIFDEHFHNDKIKVHEFMAITYSIFREDMLLADKGCYRFSAQSHEGFLSFSD